MLASPAIEREGSETPEEPEEQYLKDTICRSTIYRAYWKTHTQTTAIGRSKVKKRHLRI